MLAPSSSLRGPSLSAPRRRLNVKSLNREFQIFRHNALQKRRFREQKFRFHGGEGGEDRVRLLSDEEDEVDAESGASPASSSKSAVVPPYARRAESLSFELDRLEESVERLEAVLNRSAERPLFDDDGDDEVGLGGGGGDAGRSAALTREVQGGVRAAHKALGALREEAHRIPPDRAPLESRLALNMARALADRLKRIMEKFGKVQSQHLKRAKARESKTSKYFEDFVLPEEDALLDVPAAAANGRISTQELIQLEENSKALQQREREINKVVQSISDLNTIFQDLARMVSEQGEVVDRIDCNIEVTSVKVRSGLEELKKADRLQGKNRKMKCILILTVIVILLLFVLLIKIS